MEWRKQGLTDFARSGSGTSSTALYAKFICVCIPFVVIWMHSFTAGPEGS